MKKLNALSVVPTTFLSFYAPIRGLHALNRLGKIRSWSSERCWARVVGETSGSSVVALFFVGGK